MKKILIVSLLASLFMSTTTFAQTDAKPIDPSTVTSAPAVPLTQTGDQVSGWPDSQSEMQENISAINEGKCFVNGKEVSCEQLMDGVGDVVGIGLIILLGLVVFGVVCFVFWIIMLIHAIKHPIENKAIWIICFIFFGVITAIIYYFVVKRSFAAPSPFIPSSIPPVTPSPLV